MQEICNYIVFTKLYATKHSPMHLDSTVGCLFAAGQYAFLLSRFGAQSRVVSLPHGNCWLLLHCWTHADIVLFGGRSRAQQMRGRTGGNSSRPASLHVDDFEKAASSGMPTPPAVSVTPKATPPLSVPVPSLASHKSGSITPRDSGGKDLHLYVMGISGSTYTAMQATAHM